MMCSCCCKHPLCSIQIPGAISIQPRSARRSKTSTDKPSAGQFCCRSLRPVRTFIGSRPGSNNLPNECLPPLDHLPATSPADSVCLCFAASPQPISSSAQHYLPKIPAHEQSDIQLTIEFIAGQTNCFLEMQP